MTMPTGERSTCPPPMTTVPAGQVATASALCPGPTTALRALISCTLVTSGPLGGGAVVVVSVAFAGPESPPSTSQPITTPSVTTTRTTTGISHSSMFGLVFATPAGLTSKTTRSDNTELSSGAASAE